MGINKDFYTYTEIVTGLRAEMGIGKKWMEDLNKHIVFVTEDDIESQLYLKPKVCGILEEKQEIVLDVSKKPSTISELYCSIRDQSKGVRSPKYNATYKLTDNGEEVGFALADTPGYNCVPYNPGVAITDYNLFVKEYQELIHSKYYDFPAAVIAINPFQSLMFRGNSITLYNGISGNSGTVSYNLSSDTLITMPLSGKPKFYLLALLSTQIPRYQIPEEYLEVLDSNPEDMEHRFTFPCNAYFTNAEYCIKHDKLELVRKK